MYKELREHNPKFASLLDMYTSGVDQPLGDTYKESRTVRVNHCKPRIYNIKHKDTYSKPGFSYQFILHRIDKAIYIHGNGWSI
jgi:hypothetical protein